MQINLTGFLNGKNARLFMGELWELLLSAQASENGIPESFTQQKKEEIKKRMVNSFTIATSMFRCVVDILTCDVASPKFFYIAEVIRKE